MLRLMSVCVVVCVSVLQQITGLVSVFGETLGKKMNNFDTEALMGQKCKQIMNVMQLHAK